MTAPTLVENVGDAIRESMEAGKLQPERAAKAALDACGFDELLQALRTLVAAKDEKELHGDTQRYREMKDRGWTEARALLARLDGKPTRESGTAEEPLFYLKGNVILKRPISRKTETGKTISVGFPVCTVSEYVSGEDLVKLFNESAA